MQRKILPKLYFTESANIICILVIVDTLANYASIILLLNINMDSRTINLRFQPVRR